MERMKKIQKVEQSVSIVEDNWTSFFAEIPLYISFELRGTGLCCYDMCFFRLCDLYNSEQVPLHLTFISITLYKLVTVFTPRAVEG